jgi:hypothetical protein
MGARLSGALGARLLPRMCVGEPLVNLELHFIDVLDTSDSLQVLRPHQRDVRVPVKAKLDALRGSSTERKARANEAVGTKILARDGTGGTETKAPDQGSDHGTKTGLGLDAARELLGAIADGSLVSVALAPWRRRSSKSLPLRRRLRSTSWLLQNRSPFAMVHAVELAELCLKADAGASERSG